MYCMTGRRPEGTGSEQGATASERASGLRAGLRRLWHTGSAERAAAESGTAGATAPTAPTAPAADAATATASAGSLGAPDDSAQPAAPDPHMPGLLQQAAAWAWRILLVGLVIYLAFRLVVFLRLVTLPRCC
jgi:hypothetical protein